MTRNITFVAGEPRRRIVCADAATGSLKRIKLVVRFAQARGLRGCARIGIRDDVCDRLAVSVKREQAARVRGNCHRINALHAALGAVLQCLDQYAPRSSERVRRIVIALPRLS